MKPKQLFIVLIIILLATTLLFPKTKEQRYCDQFSGESNALSNSNDYLACENDSRCKVDKESILTKETDEDSFSYTCIPVNGSTLNQFPE